MKLERTSGPVTDLPTGAVLEAGAKSQESSSLADQPQLVESVDLPAHSSGLAWHQLFRRPQIVQSLEAIQDLIAVSLCMGLFCVMALQLKAIFASLLATPQFHAITADILFILILVELFRLLIIYLQEQRVSIGVSVEIAIVSVLREVIVNGVLETAWQQMLAVCLFLATAALLLVVRVWLPPTFEGVDPEAQVSARLRRSHH